MMTANSAVESVTRSEIKGRMMSNGMVNFSAEIIAEPMTLPVIRRVMESGVPGHFEDVHVDMGNVSASLFSFPGSMAMPKMFAIQCEHPGAQKVRIVFNGMSSDTINGVMGTTNPTMGVQLQDESGAVLPINEAREYPLYAGQNVLRFSSCLTSTRLPVMPGRLAAVAVFTLSYL